MSSTCICYMSEVRPGPMLFVNQKESTSERSEKRRDDCSINSVIELKPSGSV